MFHFQCESTHNLHLPVIHYRCVLIPIIANIKPPISILLFPGVLSLMTALYYGGKILLFELAGMSRNSVLIARSGSVAVSNVCNSMILFLIN